MPIRKKMTAQFIIVVSKFCWQDRHPTTCLNAMSFSFAREIPQSLAVRAGHLQVLTLSTRTFGPPVKVLALLLLQHRYGLLVGRPPPQWRPKFVLSFAFRSHVQIRAHLQRLVRHQILQNGACSDLYAIAVFMQRPFPHSDVVVRSSSPLTLY